MRRFIPVLGLVSGLVALSALPAEPCGDKLLLLGRGIRFQSRHTPRPAEVLLYVPAHSVATGAVSDPKLESALREAGHKVRSVVSRQEAEEALRAGQYDVVLADLEDAPEMEAAIPRALARPALLPVVARDTKAEADAKKQYRVVLRIPGRAGHYCAAVDKAFELKLKSERSSSPRT